MAGGASQESGMQSISLAVLASSRHGRRQRPSRRKRGEGGLVSVLSKRRSASLFRHDRKLLGVHLREHSPTPSVMAGEDLLDGPGGIIAGVDTRRVAICLYCLDGV